MNFIRNTTFRTIAALTLILVLDSCYRMPGDDDFSVVPTTNNPAVTHEKSNTSLMPSVGY
ncbi:MAG: hypothetical protein H0W88_10485 [Parachlamydiaceae bacterium]|nr:hypothetical protein [Parachlamydiaceae bacterium]